MRIVPPFHELEDRHSRLGLRFEPLAVEQLTFQGREEALAQGVVVAVAGRPHRGADAGLLASFSEGDRGVLTSLVGMMDDRRGTAAPQRHVQGIEHQLGAQMCLHRPSHDPPGEGVQNHRQVQEPGPRRDVGDVGHPELFARRARISPELLGTHVDDVIAAVQSEFEKMFPKAGKPKVVRSSADFKRDFSQLKVQFRTPQ